jgi:hypothetical protein
MKLRLAAIASCCLAFSAAASAGTWNFTFTDVYTDAPWAPKIDLKGQFSGEDTNHDGKITADEVTSLYFVNTFMYGGNPNQVFQIAPAYDLGGPWDGSHEYYSHLDAFEYWLPGVSSEGRPTGDFLAGLSASGGQDYKNNFEILFGGNTEAAEGDWTQDAKGFSMEMYYSTVNVAPVPEPATWALALSGLLAVAGARRGRRAKSDEWHKSPEVQPCA